MTDPASYRPRPTRLGHLVLKVRDIDRSLAFYTEVVGLTVSDWIDHHMVFLRAGEDHHDLALLQLPPGHTDIPEGHYPAVEHFSYRLETIEEMEKVAEMLVARAIPIDRGIVQRRAFGIYRTVDRGNQLDDI